MPARAPRLGLISDTHGLLRPQALAALRGCERILHAGDIGKAGVLEALAALAPVDAVRGNNDTAPWAHDVPEAVQLEWRGLRLHVVHDQADLRTRFPAPSGTDVVVFGHSHKPLVETRNGLLHVNPGSAGPRRFRLPVTVAELRLDRGTPDVRIVELDLTPM